MPEWIDDITRFIFLEDAPAPAPGLHLAFDENAVVQGFIYSEILGNRPRARRNTWNPYAR